MKKPLLLIYHWKLILLDRNWYLKILYAETQHPNLEVLLAQTVAPILGVDLTFGSIVVIVIYPIFQFQIVFANNAKMKKEKETRFLDRSHLWNQFSHT